MTSSWERALVALAAAVALAVLAFLPTTALAAIGGDEPDGAIAAQDAPDPAGPIASVADAPRAERTATHPTACRVAFHPGAIPQLKNPTVKAKTGTRGKASSAGEAVLVAETHPIATPMVILIPTLIGAYLDPARDRAVARGPPTRRAAISLSPDSTVPSTQAEKLEAISTRPGPADDTTVTGRPRILGPACGRSLDTSDHAVQPPTRPARVPAPAARRAGTPTSFLPARSDREPRQHVGSQRRLGGMALSVRAPSVPRPPCLIPSYRIPGYQSPNYR